MQWLKAVAVVVEVVAFVPHGPLVPEGIAPFFIRDFLLQNMVYFNKTIPGIQKSFLIARKAVAEKGPIPAEEARLIYDSLKEVARAEHERLFVVMTAHAKGWSFAKDLDFYMTGCLLFPFGMFYS